MLGKIERSDLLSLRDPESLTLFAFHPRSAWEVCWILLRIESMCGRAFRSMKLSAGTSSLFQPAKLPESPVILPVAEAEPSQCRWRQTCCETEKKFEEWRTWKVVYVMQEVLCLIKFIFHRGNRAKPSLERRVHQGNYAAVSVAKRASPRDIQPRASLKHSSQSTQSTFGNIRRARKPYYEK